MTLDEWQQHALRSLLGIGTIRIRDFQVQFSDVTLQPVGRNERNDSDDSICGDDPTGPEESVMRSGARSVLGFAKKLSTTASSLKYDGRCKDFRRKLQHRVLTRAINSRALLDDFIIQELYGPTDLVVEEVKTSLWRAIKSRIIAAAVREAPPQLVADASRVVVAAVTESPLLACQTTVSHATGALRKVMALPSHAAGPTILHRPHSSQVAPPTRARARHASDPRGARRHPVRCDGRRR